MTTPTITSRLARIDVLDRLFYAATGMLSPGKDYPAAMGEPYTNEERRERYARWCAEDLWNTLLD
jgi:hypothetical protein